MGSEMCIRDSLVHMSMHVVFSLLLRLCCGSRGPSHTLVRRWLPIGSWLRSNPEVYWRPSAPLEPHLFLVRAEHITNIGSAATTVVGRREV